MNIRYGQVWEYKWQNPSRHGRLVVMTVTPIRGGPAWNVVVLTDLPGFGSYRRDRSDQLDMSLAWELIDDSQ